MKEEETFPIITMGADGVPDAIRYKHVTYYRLAPEEKLELGDCYRADPGYLAVVDTPHLRTDSGNYYRPVSEPLCPRGREGYWHFFNGEWRSHYYSKQLVEGRFPRLPTMLLKELNSLLDSGFWPASALREPGPQDKEVCPGVTLKSDGRVTVSPDGHRNPHRAVLSKDEVAALYAELKRREEEQC